MRMDGISEKMWVNSVSKLRLLTKHMRSKSNLNRYEFEANKRNNLIFYGLAGGEKETPQQLRTKV